jgi:hypothetical protein
MPRLARGNSRRTKILLLAFIISPLAVLTVLCILIARSLEQNPGRDVPPIGAGAGKTGMSNETMGLRKRPEP